MVKHDENKDLRSFSRIGKVNFGDKTLKASKTSIGIRMWGKIDYLTKYCGWSFIADNSIVINNNYDDTSDAKRLKRKSTTYNEKVTSKKQ